MLYFVFLLFPAFLLPDKYVQSCYIIKSITVMKWKFEVNKNIKDNYIYQKSNFNKTLTLIMRKNSKRQVFVSSQIRPKIRWIAVPNFNNIDPCLFIIEFIHNNFPFSHSRIQNNCLSIKPKIKKNITKYKIIWIRCTSW